MKLLEVPTTGDLLFDSAANILAGALLASVLDYMLAINIWYASPIVLLLLYGIVLLPAGHLTMKVFRTMLTLIGVLLWLI